MDKKHCQLEELRKIAADDYSAHAFASRLESQGLLHAPKNLKESILLQSQSPAVGAEQLLSRTAKRLELFFYSLKVSFAVLSALALLFASSFALNLTDSMPAQPAELSWSAKLSQHTDRAGDQLRAFTDKLTTMEVFHYDDK